MILRVVPIAGVIPRLSPRELPDNAAQVAVNCYFDGGAIRPWNSPGASVATVANSNGLTIYRFGQDVVGDAQYWFSYAGVRDIARVPVAGDTAEKTVITGGSYPEITDSSLAVASSPYPADTYRLGITTPDTAISTATVGGTATPNTSAEDRYYIYTWVTSWGEESAPSPAKGPVSVKPGEYVDLSGIPAIPSGGFVDRGNVTLKRIYRSNTGSASTEYQFVAEIAIATTTLHDAVADGDLGEVCPSLNWDEPPNDLHSVVGLTNGMVAGISGNEVCICEPFRPWAFPEDYRTAFDFKPVGLGAFGGYLVVCTNGDPYIGFATTPEAYTFERLRVAQGCVAKRSIVSTGDGVIYASSDGLVAVAAGGAPVITAPWFDRDTWQKINPSSLVGAFVDGRYHGRYSGASAPFNSYTGFILDLTNKTLVFTNIAASAMYVDPANDALYLQQGTSIVKWNAGSAATMILRSKRFELPTPKNFGAAQALVTSGTLTVDLYSVKDGTTTLRKSKSVTASTPYRLPAGYKARTVEIEISGTGSFESVIAAETMKELAGV